MHCDKPTVVKIHGYCVAGGTDIALHADQVITASDAQIGLPADARVGRARRGAMGAPTRRPARETPSVHR